MNIQNAFPSKYLKSGDVEDGDLVLTIKSVEIEDIGQGDKQEQKPIIYFEETDKGMVLNKTNADTISRLHTPETDNWIGKMISVFATEVDFAGKQTLALRVRMKAPKPTTSTTTQNGKSRREKLIERYNELNTEAANAGIDWDHRPADEMTDDQIVDAGKALKAKIEAAKDEIPW